METTQLLYVGEIAKGLKSRELPEVIKTIALCPIRINGEGKCTAYVNTILRELADLFGCENVQGWVLLRYANDVRLRIVVALRGCNKEKLEAADCIDELVKRGMRVLNSVDVRARSIALLFFGAIAPLVASELRVHHVILESLESENELEVHAAISILDEFGSRSKSFCELVIAKCTDLLLAPDTDLAMKKRLASAVCERFHPDADIRNWREHIEKEIRPTLT